jgi:glycosyltransferase involved in cell wall biosynthesis
VAQADPPACRVVIDLRPLQEPERMPATAAYLERLLDAFAEQPLAGESFVLLLELLRPDPTERVTARGLPVAGRRWIPPTGRVLRSARLTLDPFLLRGAEIGAAGTIYHTAGGAVPLGSRLPVVATVLDLAPWELPERYARSSAARFGHRLRARVLRDAAALIVTSRATGESARRRVHIDPHRVAVIPLAAHSSPELSEAETTATLQELRKRFALPERYLLFSGRYDARRDMGTLFDALAILHAEEAAGSADEGAWPPVLVLPGAPGSADQEASALDRAVQRRGIGDLVRFTPRLSPVESWALLRGARGVVYPALSEGTGSDALDALAAGVPVIASRVGPLPDTVGRAGIIVEPRDDDRLASALRTLWGDSRVQRQIVEAARRRAAAPLRTWADVARDTRRVYAAAAAGTPLPASLRRLVG